MKKLIKEVEQLKDKKLLKFLSQIINKRVQIVPEFIETEENLVTHMQLILICGEKKLVSSPLPMAWPVMKMPVPEAFDSMFGEDKSDG